MPFPHHPRKHSAPAVVTPARFVRYLHSIGAPPAPSPSSVVLWFTPHLTKYAIERWGARPVESIQRLYVRGRGASQIGLAEVRGVGGPALALTVEELVAIGARRFLAVGYAGGLQTDLAVGSWVLCSRAIRDEGTSHHYARPAKYARPTPGFLRAIEAELRRSGTSYRRGTSWTIDAVYRETALELRTFRDEGVLTVEMEASALFTVARDLGAEAAALFTVSDLLDETEWHPRFHEARPRLEAQLDFAIEAVTRLARAEKTGSYPRSGAVPRRSRTGRSGPGAG